MIYRFDGYELDTQALELRRDGVPCKMEGQVFDVLAFLVENHDRVVPKQEIMERVWGDRFVTESALNSRMMAARKAIGDSGKEQRLIKTVHGRGYRFTGDVKADEARPPTIDVPATTRPLPAADREQIRFCRAPDGTQLAYATLGEGPPLVKTANWLTHLDYDYDSPVWGHLVKEIASRFTFIRYDERGSGLSDRDAEQSFDKWVEDLEAVADTLELKSFPLLGISQGGAVAIKYAALHPERVSHLILYGTYSIGWRYWSPGGETGEAARQLVIAGWGRRSVALRQGLSSMLLPSGTLEEINWLTDLQGHSASRGTADLFFDIFGDVNTDEYMEKIKAPTIVFHSQRDQMVPFREGRRIAAMIPGARFVPLDSDNHIVLEREPAWRTLRSEMMRFLGVEASGQRREPESVRTVLFTDIEGSTELTQRLGDAGARELFRRHEAMVREAIAAHRGAEIKALGDGFMASFPSPTRAIECAIAIQRASQADEEQPLRVRIGVNAGEPIDEGEDLFGTAVIMAARVAAQALGGEILVTDVVRQLVAGKGFGFSNRGPVKLRGFEEPVTVFAVEWARA